MELIDFLLSCHDGFGSDWNNSSSFPLNGKIFRVLLTWRRQP
jgi:hypothetical protein